MVHTHAYLHPRNSYKRPVKIMTSKHRVDTSSPLMFVEAPSRKLLDSKTSKLPILEGSFGGTIMISPSGEHPTTYVTFNLNSPTADSIRLLQYKKNASESPCPMALLANPSRAKPAFVHPPSSNLSATPLSLPVGNHALLPSFPLVMKKMLVLLSLNGAHMCVSHSLDCYIDKP